MEVQSETENDAIAFIYALDAASWAEFLRKKLCSDDYNIPSSCHDPRQDHVPDLFSSGKNCAVLVSPSSLEQDHFTFWHNCVNQFHKNTLILFLGVSREDLMVSLGEDISQQVLKHHFLEVDGSQVSVSNALVGLIKMYESTDSMHEDNVFEADTDEMSSDSSKYNDDENNYDFLPAPRPKISILRVIPTVLYEHGSRDVLVLLEREAEDTITVTTKTDLGPSQGIHVERVTSSSFVATLPNNIHGKVDLEVQAGKHKMGYVTVQVQSCMEQLHFLLQKETNPFTLMCKAMGIAGASCSEVEELDSLLAQHLSISQFPLGLIGVMHSDDKTMADHEDRHWPTLLHFAAEFNLQQVCSELLLYPGMIHAACTENSEGLFPCQLAENKGFYAVQKQLMQFVEDSRLRRSAADSGISFSDNFPPPPCHRPSSHEYINDKPQAWDQSESSDDDYMVMTNHGPPAFQGANEMGLSTCHGVHSKVFNGEPAQGSLPLPQPCLMKLKDGYVKPRSFSEGCVKTPYARIPSEARIAEEEDSQENNSPPLKPKVGRTQSAASEYIPCSYITSRQQQPDPGNSGSANDKDRHILCALTSSRNQEQDPSNSEKSDSYESKPSESTSRSSTGTLMHCSSEPRAMSPLRHCSSEPRAMSNQDQRRSATSEGMPSRLESQSGNRPASQASSCSSQSYSGVPLDQQGVYADTTAEIHTQQGKQSKPKLRLKGEVKQNKTLQDKISNFFKKMSRRNHSSEGDLRTMAKGDRKTIFYGRQSTVSTASSSSDPSGYLSTSLRADMSSMYSDSGRDSGAVCDDFDPPVMMRSEGRDRTTPRNSGKRNGTSMQKRMSMRIQRARNEDLSGRPTLPAQTTETFVSFIKLSDASVSETATTT